MSDFSLTSFYIGMFASAPESQADPCLLEMVQKWDKPAPTPIQMLEVIDAIVHASLASSFVLNICQKDYDSLLASHNTTHEEVAKNATWRNDGR